MATLKIRIKDGFFVEGNGEGELSSTYVRGNGWECHINSDGSLLCECSREYSDGLYSIRYTIRKDGFARLTLKTPYRYEVLRKGFVTRKGVPFGNGLLGLAGGNVEARYAYFRDSSFQEFLDRFGITAVKHEDPNQVFRAFSNHSGWGNAWQKVSSDGDVEWDYEDAPGSREYFESPGNNPNLYSGTVSHAVSGARWALVETKEDYRDNHNHAVILYTLEKDVMGLEGSLASVLNAEA